MRHEVLDGARDGTAQAGRARPELAPDYVRLDERSPADLLAFVEAYARHLRWYGPDAEPDGDWGAMFAGIAASPGADAVSYAEAAAFAADPAAFADPRFDVLRRPHLMLLLACVRLLRHGQAAVNAIGPRHHDDQLRRLGLAPAPARADRAFVLFDLAPGTAAVEAPAGLRLLAGRDDQRRERVFALDAPLVVTRARVARLATAFVDREVVDLAAACRTTAAGSDARLVEVLGLAYGTPNPGDPLPPLAGAPLTAARWSDLATLLAFGETALQLRPAELRALIARKRLRDADAADWQVINSALQTAGRAVRGDAGWQFTPADPRAFEANLATVYRGDPLKGERLEQVSTIDDVDRRLADPEVAKFVRATLRMEPDRFAAIMALKRAADVDWQVIRGYLAAAGQRRTGDAGWTLPDTAGRTDIAAALGAVDWRAAGPEAKGVRDLDQFYARIAQTERWFLLPAEKISQLLPLLGLDEPAGAQWDAIAALLTEARLVKSIGEERDAARKVRVEQGLPAALAYAGGESGGGDGAIEPVARWLAPDKADRIRAAVSRPAPAADDLAGWAAVDAALAEARRRRLALPAPVPRLERWHALWADAFDPPAAAEEARPLFGAPGSSTAGARPATLGWAIASPALALSAGRRTVTLTLVLTDDGGDLPLDPRAARGSLAAAPFDVDISAGATWLSPADLTVGVERFDEQVDPARRGGDRRRLRVTFTFSLSPDQPATAPPLAGGTDPRWPALRLRLRAIDRDGRASTAYARWRDRRLMRAELRIAIGGDGAEDGLWPLDIEGDAGRIDGKRPFEPFGAAAPPGSRLLIAHPDLAAKQLTAVALRWQWQQPPVSLPRQYQNYAKRDFTAALALVEPGAPPRPLVPLLQLFGEPTAKPMRTSDLPIPPSPLPLAGERRFALTLGEPGFGHADYQGVALETAARQAAALQKAVAEKTEKPDPAGFVVLPPWTPRLRRLSLDVSAAHAVDLRAYQREGAIDRVYQLHPFGTLEAPDKAVDGWPLLPPHDEEGSLYIGLDRVAGAETLSILVNAIAPGLRRPEGLRWSYLDADGWRDLAVPADDTTAGLARTGLLRFVLPAASPDTRMPTGLFWLRATVASGAAGAGCLAGIHAQAGAASTVDATGRAPLPAGTIRTVADPVPGLAKVRQPYPSVGGEPPEDQARFHLAAAERLRHKGRAVTAWDYERLVLARFAAVNKVKCLPATLANGLGEVRLVVVPDARGLRLADPFAPRASAALLDEIAAYLRPLAPAAARITVRHPHFVRVRVRIAVKFRGADDAFNARRLAEALDRRLAPWAFDGEEEVAIGQRIDAAALVAFVDGLPFVDFVAGCRLFQADEDGDLTFGPDGGDAAASNRPDAVLTSAGAHEIDVVTDEGLGDLPFTGIGRMKIGLDLIVATTVH